jgi:hypothetical protein
MHLFHVERNPTIRFYGLTAIFSNPLLQIGVERVPSTSEFFGTDHRIEVTENKHTQMRRKTFIYNSMQLLNDKFKEMLRRLTKFPNHPFELDANLTWQPI